MQWCGPLLLANTPAPPDPGLCLLPAFQQDKEVTENFAARLDLDISLAVVQAWWGADGPLPERLALTVLLDGTEPRGAARQACQLRRSAARTDGRGAWRPVIRWQQPLPLPVGAHITRLRKAGPAALELHAVSEGGSGSQAAAAAAAAPAPAVDASPPPATQEQRLEQQAAARPLDPKPGSEQAGAPEAAAEAAVGADPNASLPAGGSGSSSRANSSSSGAAAAAAAGAAPGCASGSTSPAALQALASLQAITLPPPGVPDEDAALMLASLEAFTQVEAAAQALGLPPAQVHAVCDAVEARTRAHASTRRFVGMELRLLWRACTRGGAAGVPLARAWMARLAAATGAGDARGAAG
jgi:hypothetical protein